MSNPNETEIRNWLLKNYPFEAVFIDEITRQVKGYSMLPNPSPQYLLNYRIHHYQIGLGLLLLGIIKNKPFLITFGSVLVLDDKEDLIKDFNKFFRN